MKQIKLCYANSRGIKSNAIYPNQALVNNADEFKRVVMHDYSCSICKNNHLSNDNFIYADSIGFDIDNDSDNASEWINVNDVKTKFPEVMFYVYYSRNHYKVKDVKSPRPRFHIIFLINEVSNAEEYRNLKVEFKEIFPYVDKMALDSARKFFGTENPVIEAIDGTTTIDEYLKDLKAENFLLQDKPILEGTRNSVMYKIAVKSLKRYGDTAESHNYFLNESNRCTPALDDTELKSIWNSAVKFYNTKVVISSTYIKPDEYNQVEKVKWDEVILLEKRPLLEFPIEVLPDSIKNYCIAVSEATQTPIDMAGVISLSILALSMQRRYKIKGKADWIEPLNIYAVVVAEPSERKSAVINQMIKVVHAFELNFNESHALEREKSEIEYQALITKRNKIVKDIEKGKATTIELDEVITKINGFNRLHKLVLTADDVTSEVLANSYYSRPLINK